MPPRTDKPEDKGQERYRRLSSQIDVDEKYLALSKELPSGRTLFKRLILGPETGILPGLVVAGQAGLAEALDWSLEDFRRCWQEIEAQGLAQADWKVRLIWLPNGVLHNPPGSPNVCVQWFKAFRTDVPACDLREQARLRIVHFLSAKGYRQSYLDAFTTGTYTPDKTPVEMSSAKTSKRSSRKTSQTTSGTTSTRTSRNQEQDQEQDLLKNDTHTGAARPTRTLGAGVMGGSLQREHLSHAWCGTYRKCVPAFLHAEFLGSLGGDRAAAQARLEAFYEATIAAIPADEVLADEAPRFWRPRFRASFGAKPATSRVLPEAPGPHTGLDDLKARLEVYLTHHKFCEWVAPLQFVRQDGDTVTASASTLVVHQLTRFYRDAVAQACADTGLRLELVDLAGLLHRVEAAG